MGETGVRRGMCVTEFVATFCDSHGPPAPRSPTRKLISRIFGSRAGSASPRHVRSSSNAMPRAYFVNLQVALATS